MPPKKTPAKSLLATALDEAETQLQEESPETVNVQDESTVLEPRQSKIPIRKTGHKSKSSSALNTSVKRSKKTEEQKSDDSESSTDESDADYDLGSDSFYESEAFKLLTVADRATLRRVKGFFETRVVSVFKAIESYGGFKLKEIY